MTTAMVPSRRARLAAVAALIAVFGVLGILVYALLTAAGDLLLALASVFLVAVSTWFVLTRRGSVRLLGLLPALLGLVGIVNFVGGHWLELLAHGGLLTLFALAGSYAVRLERSALHAANGGSQRTQPARKGVLIINPKAGGGKAQRLNLAKEARERGIEPVLLGGGDDLRELALKAAADGADVIGMAGGDGSQATVARVARENDLAHVCVPAGTRNHFALDLGLDRNDAVGALDAFTDGVERRIDLAAVNDYVFVNNASLGLYAAVVQEEAYRDAKLTTWTRTLPEIVGPDGSSIDLRFAGPDGKNWPGATVVLVSNNPYRLKGFRGARTRPRLDTGRLGIVATRIRGSRDLANLVTLGTLAQSRRFHGLSDWSCPHFEVHSGAAVPVGIDGEAHLLAAPLQFVSLHRALRIRVPRRANGLSPAAAGVVLSRDDLAGLLRIAFGKSASSPPAGPVRSVT
jgi:diacylglycerol kinase family enzyme